MNTEKEFSILKKEMNEIDLRFLGQFVYDQSIALSKRINIELLEPMSRWLDDPDWMSRHEITENELTDWSAYKRKAREWTVKQKRLAAEHLNKYWSEIKKKKAFRKKISELLNVNAQERKGTNVGMRKKPPFNDGFLVPIVFPFSPKEINKTETARKFQESRQLSVSDFLPWKLIILEELKVSKTLNTLKTYYPDDTKKETVSKFMHLLQLESDGILNLVQQQHFGEIMIELNGPAPESTIEIKDRNGLDYRFVWNDLSDMQRERIITDIKSNKILCKQVIME